MLQPVIQHYPQKWLAGFSFFGDPFHSHAGWTETNEIGLLWRRLMGFWEQPSVQNTAFAPMGVSYEVHFQSYETPRTGKFEVFAGFEVSDWQNLPLELCLKRLPESDYAVFTLTGEQIRSDEPIMDNWLKASGYRLAYPVFVQRYDKRFKGVHRLAESVLDMLIPVVKDA